MGGATCTEPEQHIHGPGWSDEVWNLVASMFHDTCQMRVAVPHHSGIHGR